MQSCCKQLDIFTSPPSLEQTLPQLLQSRRVGAVSSCYRVLALPDRNVSNTAFAGIEDKTLPKIAQ